VQGKDLDRARMILPDKTTPNIVKPQRVLSENAAIWVADGNETRDSVSSVDRARGLLIRNIPHYLAMGGMAAGATLVFHAGLMMANVDLMPWMLDRFLIFISCMSLLISITHVKLSKLEYEHSRAGIERLRLTTFRDLAYKEMDQNLEYRKLLLEEFNTIEEEG